MNKSCFLVLALLMSLLFSITSVEAAPLLSNPYMVPIDANDEVGKEVPLNLVDLRYVGENPINDILLNDKLVGKLNFKAKKNDTIIIKNMGKYKKEIIDVNIQLFEDSEITFFQDGTLWINTRSKSSLDLTFSMNVYQHDTKIIYPDLYVGFSDIIGGGFDNYRIGDLYGTENLYGLYLPKILGTFLGSANVTQHDGFLDMRYGKVDQNNSEAVYPIFKNAETGLLRGRYWTGIHTVKLFNAAYPSPIPIPYDEVSTVNNEQEATNIASLDVHYIVTQKLFNYVTPSHYPTDQTFKIKTNFALDSIEGSPVEAVVKLANNQVVDKRYYSSVFSENSHEITFSTDFLKEYKGTIIKIDYKQSLDSKNSYLMDYYHMNETAFIFPYSSENKWERREQNFKQEKPSVGQTKVNFPIELGAEILNGEKVIQNKSTDDYNPLDFISALTSNLPGDSVSANFTKKVIFENEGEQNVYITLKSSLSSVTKEIIVKVSAIEGTLHFTEVPSDLLFPTITLTGKVSDYEVSSFNQGSLSVSDARLTRAPWSLTATLTENKMSNNFGDILYFRNAEGIVYNITDQTQIVMANRELGTVKKVIDYEQNKQIGLFVRINPLFVKKGPYEGNVTWSLVDAPN
ncbi:hypothetical protein [Carnobacterium maltaromaticum]|uniref:hypothetical protein n=1 Tax=Carnobacterium maltaromaticum TaxID=2751 RepID=UPI0039BDE1FD